jgi:3-hydroxyisobutyrate dehydrogenase
VAEACDIVFTSLPTPADVQKVGTGENGLIEGFRNGSAWFDLSTNAVDVVRSLHATFAEKGIDFLDAPVSGGPKGANSGKLAIWVGGDKAVFDKYHAALSAMGDQAVYIGPIGAGSIAKLVHNASSAAVNVVLSEVFTMGIKAGVEPLALFEAVRQGASGRNRMFDRLADHFLTGSYDPADFALRLLHKDVTLACQLAREVQVPMRLTNLALMELTEALNRGWGARDSRVGSLLQQERAGIPPIAVSPDKIKAVFESDAK